MNIASIPGRCFYCGQTVFASSMNSEVVLTHDFENAMEHHRQTECPFYASLRNKEIAINEEESSFVVMTHYTLEEGEEIQQEEIRQHMSQVPANELSEYTKFVPTNFVTGKKAKRQAVFRKRDK